MKTINYLPLMICLLFIVPLHPVQAANPHNSVPFTLEKVVQRVLFFNRNIQGERDNVLIARFALTSSKAEFQFQLSPTVFYNSAGENNGVGAGLSISRKLPRGTFLSVTPTIEKNAGIFTSGVDVLLSQPIFKGFSKNYNRENIRQSEYALKTAERRLFLTRTNVVLAAISALYRVMETRELLELHESSFKRLQGYVRAAQTRQKKGLATAMDVFRANIQYQQSESNLNGAQEQHLDALDLLKIILNIPMEQEIKINAPLTYTIAYPQETAVIEAALQKREELKQLLDMIAFLAFQTKVAKHKLLPQLTIDLHYTSSGEDSRWLDSFRKNQGSLGVNLATSGNISRTVEKAGYERSKITLRSAERLLSIKKDEIKRDVKNSLRYLKRLGKNIAIHKKQVHDARGKLELSKIKFQHGMADNFNLIESEEQFRRAQISFKTSIIRFIVAGYRLKAAAGTLSEHYGF